MSVITVTAEKAVTLLKALKADFKIILPTGEEYGNLEVARASEKRKNTNKRGSLFALYAHVLKDMQPGDVGVIPVPEGIVAENLRGAISGYASTRWGKGSARTVIENNTVEILRVQ